LESFVYRPNASKTSSVVITSIISRKNWNDCLLFTGEWDFWFTDTFGSSGMPESDRERRAHRIRVSQKKSDEAVLIHQIQLLAVRQGKTGR
jgi:hypothetical protein